MMQRWMVVDRFGREIYLTEAEWEDHIMVRHPELEGLLDDVLETIRHGRRKQDRIRPNKYFYRRNCSRLPDEFEHIIVVVLFKPNNNYVVAAWAV